MPWGLILEAGLVIIQFFIRDLEKQSAAKRRFIEFIEKRVGLFNTPKELHDDYLKASAKLKERIEALKNGSTPPSS